MLCLGLLLGSGAMAQSLFEALFGLPSPAGHPPQRSAPLRTMGRPMSDRGEPARLRDLRTYRDGDDDGAYAGAGMSGGVQTMCVRTCDGYYWPVRYPASRRDFAKDADACMASCGGAETKLYFRAGPGVEAEEMKDADGTSYGASKTAFAYRKGTVQGCSCRPAPWSEAERARHAGYAAAEKARAAQVAAAGEPQHQDAHAAVPIVPVAKPASAGPSAGEPGPAEAAAIASFSVDTQGIQVAVEPTASGGGTGSVEHPYVINKRRGGKAADRAGSRRARLAEAGVIVQHRPRSGQRTAAVRMKPAGYQKPAGGPLGWLLQ